MCNTARTKITNEKQQNKKNDELKRAFHGKPPDGKDESAVYTREKE